MTETDELYLLARRVLLDALDALRAHVEAFILVGAQAVYLRVGEGDLAIAPYTTDGDLAIEPARLAESPALEAALKQADFRPKSKDSVGIWVTTRSTRARNPIDIGVDLLVPVSASPGSGRTAPLPGHDRRAARRVTGLDGALVDFDVMELGALEAGDDRRRPVRVAGPAALLVAKAHKISERHGTGRQSDKDALDVLRLLRAVATDELAARFKALLHDSRSAEAAMAGRELLAAQFTSRAGVGIEMATRAVGPLADPEEIAASCQVLADELLVRVAG